MSILPRVRIKNTQIVSAGKATWLGSGSVSGNHGAFTKKSECADIVDGTRNSHPLTIIHTHPLRYRIYGTSRLTGGWNYSGYAVGGGSGYPVIPAVTPEPTDNSALSKTLSRSNPNNPRVDMLVFFGEFRDFPRQIREWGEDAMRLAEKQSRGLAGIPQAAAKKNLEWNFLFAPIISDLVKITRIADETASLAKRLAQLRDKGSVGGMATAWDDVAIGPTIEGYATALYQEGNRISYNFETRRRKWATVRWLPDSPLPASNTQLARLSFQIATGTALSFSTIWNLMPWTWLIDWFSNTGDMINASRNTVPVKAVNSCVMLHTATKISNLTKISGPGTFQLVPPQTPGYEKKTRVVMWQNAALPEFNLPFLTGRQLSILASLAVTRGKLGNHR